MVLQGGVNLFAAQPVFAGCRPCAVGAAHTHACSAPQIAVDLARSARTELEALGAVREADAAAALMRALGAKGRAGPKDHGLRSRRELEGAAAGRRGLTNGEIGARLFISPKNAEHHVVRIYSKPQLRNRSEVAAYAVRKLGPLMLSGMPVIACADQRVSGSGRSVSSSFVSTVGSSLTSSSRRTCWSTTFRRLDRASSSGLGRSWSAVMLP